MNVRNYLKIESDPNKKWNLLGMSLELSTLPLLTPRSTNWANGLLDTNVLEIKIFNAMNVSKQLKKRKHSKQKVKFGPYQSNNGGHDRGRQREWRISNFPHFWQNQSVAEPFNAFFENNLPLGLFRQNMKKSTAWRRVRELWYLLTLTLKNRK